MLNKIKALPVEVYLGIGMSLILLQSPLSMIFPKNMWLSTLFRFVIFAVAIKFMFIYNNKKYSKK